MRAQLSMRDYENLSAYLDGQLSNSEKLRLEARMLANPELRSVLDEMSRTRALLRSAPRRRAPRNFTLSPAQAGLRAKPRSFFDFFPVLSFTSALAILALVFSLMLGPGGTPLSPVPELAAPAPLAQDAAAPEAAQQEQRPQEEKALSQPTVEAAEMPAAKSEAAPQGLAQQSPESASAPPLQGSPVITWGFPSSQSDLAGKSSLPVGGGLDSPNYGRGGGSGGGGPSMDLGMGSGVMDGNLVVPQVGVQGLMKENSDLQAAPADSSGVAPPLTGSGPILGVPTSGQEGQYINSLPSEGVSMASPASQDGQPGQTPAQAETPPLTLDFSMLRVLQVLLALLAVITGLAAVWLWRKNR